jgi:hypothetical protein
MHSSSCLSSNLLGRQNQVSFTLINSRLLQMSWCLSRHLSIQEWLFTSSFPRWCLLSSPKSPQRHPFHNFTLALHLSLLEFWCCSVEICEWPLGGLLAIRLGNHMLLVFETLPFHSHCSEHLQTQPSSSSSLPPCFNKLKQDWLWSAHFLGYFDPYTYHWEIKHHFISSFGDFCN